MRRVAAFGSLLFSIALQPASARAQDARGVRITPWLGAEIQGGGAIVGVDLTVGLRDRVAVEFSVGVPFVGVLGRLHLDPNGTFYLAAGPALVYADAVLVAGGQVHAYAQANLSPAIAARVGVRGIFALDVDRVGASVFDLGLSIRP